MVRVFFCFADLPNTQEGVLRKLEAGGKLHGNRSPFEPAVCLFECVYTGLTAWPKEPAELWCCPEQPASHKQGGVRPDRLVKSSHTGRSADTWHKTTENVTLHTHSWKAVASLIMAPRAAVVSQGFWCAERKGWWRRCSLVWPALAMFEVTAGTKAFIFTERDEKLQPWQWLALCLAGVINGLSSSPFAHTLFINSPASPGLLKHCFAGTFFFL